MSWEHPLQYLNHHTQPYRHYVSASEAAHQIFQFADPIPVRRGAISSVFFNLFIANPSLILYEMNGLYLTPQPFFSTSITI